VQETDSLSLIAFLQIVLMMGLPVYILGITFQIYYIYKKSNLKFINLPLKIILILLFQIMAFGLTVFLWRVFQSLPYSWFMIFNFILTPALVAELILLLFFVKYLKTLASRIGKE
jgi:hypothetical protein